MPNAPPSMDDKVNVDFDSVSRVTGNGILS